MRLFDVGETVIDKRTRARAAVMAVIPQGPDSLLNLYILRKDDDSYYIADDIHLLTYNKNYWDNLNK